MSDNAETVLLPLDSPRTVMINVGGRKVSFEFTRITDAMWQKYFAAIVNKVEQIGGERAEVYDTDTALATLFELAVSDVFGYDITTSLKDLVRAVPYKHRIAAGMVLRGVTVTPAETLTLSDTVDVTLSALWGTINGKTPQYSGLVHRFKHPSIDQLKRYRLGVSRTVVGGTADNGYTIYPWPQAVAMTLYDELIVEVDGYSVGGLPVTDRAAIAANMDGYHKAVAALQLFQRDGESVVVGTPADDDGEGA